MGLFDFLFNKKKSNNSENSLELITVGPDLSLPKVLVKFKDEILATAMETIMIEQVPVKELSIRQSKFGHYPCLPIGYEYPKDENGDYLFPLAQLNFSEIPKLPGYPESGYLQFYISRDELCGMNFDDLQSQVNFKVLFFEENEVVSCINDFSFLGNLSDYNAPVSCPHELRFTSKTEYLGLGDVRYDEERFSEIEEKLEDFVYENFTSTGSKVGGYAAFTQTDPRISLDEFKNYILLLQIDSSDQIMWGDVGICNFFIDNQDLANKDFSRVMYSWDCC